MEKEKLDGCLHSIINSSDEVRAALQGLESLYRQGESLIADMDDMDKGEISTHMKDLYTWLDLVRITLKHAIDHNESLQKTVFKAQVDDHKDLSVIQGGAV